MKLLKVGEKWNVNASFHWIWKALTKVYNVECALSSLFAMTCALHGLGDNCQETCTSCNVTVGSRFITVFFPWVFVWPLLKLAQIVFVFILERKWIKMVLATVKRFGTTSVQVCLTFFPMFSGRGFAFRRKQQIERQYKKLLKKRKVPSQQDDQFTDTYPEHLKHLYLAEEEMLKKQRRAPDAAVLSEEKLNKAEE